MKIVIVIMFSMAIFVAVGFFSSWLPANIEQDASMIQKAHLLQRIHQPLPPGAVSAIKIIGEGHQLSIWRVNRANTEMDSVLSREKEKAMVYSARKIVHMKAKKEPNTAP